MITLNILDYALVDEGKTSKQALKDTAELAQLADKLGYKRFWVPEQHFAYSIASSSPEMLMMYLATVTKRIRIGAGGVMLPHYSPYKVAENFRMLEAFHPNRIDLGIGNSPGGRLVQQALNEGKEKRLSYEQQVKDIMKYLTDDHKSNHRFQRLFATPIIDSLPEIWMLGGGGTSTEIAAHLGTAYIYAHFFRGLTEKGLESIQYYREHFQPSPFQAKPNVGVAVFTVIGETKEEAEALAKAFFLWMAWLETGKNPRYFPSVETAKNDTFNSFERRVVEKLKGRTIIGDPFHVKREIEKLVEVYAADEVTIVPNFPGIENRKKGIQMLAEVFGL